MGFIRFLGFLGFLGCIGCRGFSDLDPEHRGLEHKPTASLRSKSKCSDLSFHAQVLARNESRELP